MNRSDDSEKQRRDRDERGHDAASPRIHDLLHAHLQDTLGAWPPRQPVEVTIWPGRDRPGWNGKTIPSLGMASPDSTRFTLSPSLAPDPAALDLERIVAACRAADAETALPLAVGRPELIYAEAAFRWSAAPERLPEPGEWAPGDEPWLPDWLRPFNGGALVARDDQGRYAAGVGVKRHNQYARELAVGTDPEHRGQGLARMLIAQAARRILDEGSLPLYLHDPANEASARVADSAGFPDRGWRLFGLYTSHPANPDSAESDET